MAAIGGPPWRHGVDIDWRGCTAYYADQYGSAECTRTTPHDGTRSGQAHEGLLDDRPDQTIAWYDDEPGARPARALPTRPLKARS